MNRFKTIYDLVSGIGGDKQYQIHECLESLQTEITLLKDQKKRRNKQIKNLKKQKDILFQKLMKTGIYLEEDLKTEINR